MNQLKSRRKALRGALFVVAQERGISKQTLREEIAPRLIRKRLSAASAALLRIVLLHMVGPMKKNRGQGQG